MWGSLIVARSKWDPTILASVLNPRGLKEESDVNPETIRFVLKMLRFELPDLWLQLQYWIQRWSGSWIENKNAAKLAKLHLLLKEELTTDLWELAISELNTCCLVQSESTDALDALHAVDLAASSVKAPAEQNLQNVSQQKAVKSPTALLPSSAQVRLKQRKCL